MKKQCCPKLPFRKVTHVIFDLDGTIIDTESIIEEVLSEICEKCEKRFSPSLHNKTAGATVEDIAKLLKNELSLPLTEDEFVDMYKELIVTKFSDINFMPGAEELIQHFSKHEVPIAIATSSTEDQMLLKTQKYRRVFDLFHHIVCGGSDPEVKSGKPAPDIYLVCASRFPDDPDPANCLILEDAPNGVTGAKRAGMQVVMIPPEDIPYEIWKNATVRLSSLEHIAPELFGLPPLEIQGVPVPKISFTMHYDTDKTEKDAEVSEIPITSDDTDKTAQDDGKEGTEENESEGLQEQMFEKNELY